MSLGMAPALRLVAVLLIAGLTPLAVVAQSTPDESDSRENIQADQKRLAEQYELLEKKLFSLYQYEQEQNPERAELLENAYQMSREKLTLQIFESTVRQLEQSRFRDAEKNQDQLTAQLEQLLKLLQSEDRSKRIREQIERYKEYVKEINRILRVQQGIRGRAERQGDSDRLQKAQQDNAKRTEKLNREFEKNESQTDPSDQENQADGAEPSESSDSSTPRQSEQPGDNDSERPGDSQSGESPPGQPQPGQSPSKPGSQGEGQSTPSESPPNPVQQRLQQAQQKMDQARQKLEAARRSESVDDMRQAERELQQAKRELETILRQLREEEIARALASLETRFRRMLERQMKILADTQALEQSRGTTPPAEIDIQSGKLSLRETGLVQEAARAKLLLEDDGSSVAVLEAVRQTQADMQQVVDRLSAARTGDTTEALQKGIIETLEFLVEIFEKAQEDNAQANSGPQPPGQAGQPGEAALINQLAELKLIRGLQQQILKRHQRYSELLDDPGDPVGVARDAGIRDALERLSRRQEKLQQITHDIVVGKNQ